MSLLTESEHGSSGFVPRISKSMLSILVVDDQQDDRLIAKKLLAPYFNVITLSSAIEARAFALTHRFDVALLNVMLQTDLDCIDLLQDLRTISHSVFLPIAITCHIDGVRHNKLLAAGFAAILKKPFDRHLFNDIISKHLRIEHQKRNVKNSPKAKAII